VLRDARTFQDRLAQAYSPGRRHTQLLHVANDGETYGHHFKFGDLTLGFALHRSLEAEGFAITNYAAFLEANPPEWEVALKAGPDGLGTAWSCAHGTLRWHEDCGCTTGSQPGWNQRWRRPLRQALDGLRDQAGAVMEEHGRRLFRDPWRAADAYINVLLRRTRSVTDRFLAREGREIRTPAERSSALRLMEMRRNAMLMYTSCGWFFSDLSGIETVQCLRFAARALQLAETFSGVRLESPFLDSLDRARSNLAEWGSGRKVWNRAVRPSMMDPERIAAHYALADLVHECPDRQNLMLAVVHRRHRVEQAAGAPAPHHHVTRFVLNRIQVELPTTLEQARLVTACVRLGARKVVCAVGADSPDEAAYRELADALRREVQTFESTEPGEKRMRRLLATRVGKRAFGVEDLLPDQRLRILQWLAHGLVTQIGEAYFDLYAQNREAIESLQRAGMPAPREFAMTAEYVLAHRLEDLLREHRGDPSKTLAVGRVPPLAQARALIEEVRRLGVTPAPEAISHHLVGLMLAAIDFLGQTWDARVAQELAGFLDALGGWNVAVDLRRAQDRFARVILRDRVRPEPGATRVAVGRARSRKALEALAEKIGFAPEALARMDRGDGKA